MSEGDKPYRVFNPRSGPWAVRFMTSEAAWGRLLALKGYADTKGNRRVLSQEGWRVENTSEILSQRRTH